MRIRFTLKEYFIVMTLSAVIWTGWIGKPFIRWSSGYKNVLLRGWAGGGQLLISRGQSETYWHVYVDVVDLPSCKMQVVLAKK